MKLFESEPEREPAEPYEDLPPDPVSESQARSTQHSREFDLLAFEFIEKCGGTIVERYVHVEHYPLDALVRGKNGAHFYIDAHGTPDPTDRPNAGMRRQDTMLKFGFKALRLRDRGAAHPLILLTSHMPKATQSSAFLLTEISHALFDAIAVVGDFAGQQRLHHYLNDEPAHATHLEAPWREVQLGFDFAIAEDDDDA